MGNCFLTRTDVDDQHEEARPQDPHRLELVRRVPGSGAVETARIAVPMDRRRVTNGMVRRLHARTVRARKMEGRRSPMKIHTIGIDLGKTSFHLVGMSERGEVVVRKRFTRKQLLR